MAYYSNQGVNIYSGAAGLGALSRRSSMRRSGGPLQSYNDGVLGNYGPLMAYKDGSLGSVGPLMSFKDGSLGMPLFLETSEGLQQIEEPATIYHGSAGCGSCGGLGDTAAAMPVLNLKNAATLKELKMAMASPIWLLPYYSDPNVAATIEADIQNPKWTKDTTDLAAAWIAGYPTYLLTVHPERAKNADGSTQTGEQVLAAIKGAFTEPDLVPNAGGVGEIYLVASEGNLPTDAFPNLKAFVTALLTSGEGSVTPPPTTSQATSAAWMWGGAAALVALAFVVKK